MLAVCNARIDVVRGLLANGADINLQDKVSGEADQYDFQCFVFKVQRSIYLSI